MISAPAPTLVERFRRDAIAFGFDADKGDLGLAVSGGADSLALLLLGAAAFPGRVAAVTVDHGLRPEAAVEAEFVAGLCGLLQVPHATLSARVDPDRSSLQRAAREARYAALAGWLEDRGTGALATAHHADDQAETLMMRLVKGSGLSGLAAVRGRGPLPVGGKRSLLIRPLLGWRRTELKAIVEAAAIVPVADPSNLDRKFDRVRMRQDLAAAAWIDPVPLVRSAAALREADEALEWATDRLWQKRVSPDGGKLTFDHHNLPAELKRRLLLRLLAKARPANAPPRGEDVARLIARLEEGRTSTLAGVKCRGGQHWTFEPEKGRRTS